MAEAVFDDDRDREDDGRDGDGRGEWATVGGVGELSIGGGGATPNGSAITRAPQGWRDDANVRSGRDV